MEEQFQSEQLKQKKFQREQELKEFQRNALEAEEEVRKWNHAQKINEGMRASPDHIQYKENIGFLQNQNHSKKDQNNSGYIQHQQEPDFPEEQIHLKLKKIRDLLGINGQSEINTFNELSELNGLNKQTGLNQFNRQGGSNGLKILNRINGQNEQRQKESSLIESQEKKVIQQTLGLEDKQNNESYNEMEFANTFGKNDRIGNTFGKNDRASLDLQGEQQSQQKLYDYSKTALLSDDQQPIDYATSTFNLNFRQKNQNIDSEVKDTLDNRTHLINEDNLSEQKIDTRRFLNEYINNFDNNFELDHSNKHKPNANDDDDDDDDDDDNYDNHIYQNYNHQQQHNVPIISISKSTNQMYSSNNQKDTTNRSGDILNSQKDTFNGQKDIVNNQGILQNIKGDVNKKHMFNTSRDSSSNHQQFRYSNQLDTSYHQTTDISHNEINSSKNQRNSSYNQTNESNNQRNESKYLSKNQIDLPYSKRNDTSNQRNDTSNQRNDTSYQRNETCNQRNETYNQRDRSNQFNKSVNESHNASQHQGSFIDSGQKDVKNMNYLDDHDTKAPTNVTQATTSSKQNNTMRSLSQNNPKFELSSMTHMKTEPSNRLSDYSSNNIFQQKKHQISSITASSRLQHRNDDDGEQQNNNNSHNHNNNNINDDEQYDYSNDERYDQKLINGNNARQDYYYEESQDFNNNKERIDFKNRNDERYNEKVKEGMNQSPFRATLQDKSCISHIGIGEKQNTSLLNQSQMQMFDNSHLNTLINNVNTSTTNNRTKNSFLQTYSPPKKLISEQISFLDSNEKEMEFKKNNDQIRERINTEILNNKFEEQVGQEVENREGMKNEQIFEQHMQELIKKNKSLMNDNIRIIQQKEQLHRALMKKEQENSQLQQRIVEMEKTFNDKSDELKLKRKLELAIEENSKGVEMQIESLQKTISENQFDLQNRSNQERLLKHKLSQQQNQAYLKEEQLNNEILFFKKEIENMKYNRDILKTKGESELKTRLLEMETDLHMTRSQYHSLSEEKTVLDQQLEEQQLLAQSAMQKLQDELQKAHLQEIKELQYYISSLQQEYQIKQVNSIEKQQKKQQLQQQKEREQGQTNVKKQQHNPLLIIADRNAVEDVDVQQQLQKQISVLLDEKNVLSDENYQLMQQVNWLQLKQKSISYMDQKVEAMMHERRFGQLSDMMLYWKSNCARVCKEYMIQFTKLRKDNDKLKQTLHTTQKRFLAEYETIIKELAHKFYLESQALHTTIKELQKKYINSQSKLAEMRSKLKDASFVNTSQHTQANTTLANQVFAPINISKIINPTEKKGLSNPNKQTVKNRNKQNLSNDYSVNFKQLNQKVSTSTNNQEHEKTKKKREVVIY